MIKFHPNGVKMYEYDIKNSKVNKQNDSFCDILNCYGGQMVKWSNIVFTPCWYY
jgi:hypothetical protein